MAGKLTYRERLERDAWLAYAQHVIDRAAAEPIRIYLGSGIWWAPSLGFINSRMGRAAGRRSIEENGR